MTVITKRIDFITKCGIYYKRRRRYSRFKKFPRLIKSSNVTKYFVHIKVKNIFLPTEGIVNKPKDTQATRGN